VAKKTVYEVREQLEVALKEILDILKARVPEAPRSRGRSRTIVTVNPYNEIDVMLVSDVFEGLAFEERSQLVWPEIESRMSKSELERIERWELLTITEAKAVYPATLKPRSPLVQVR
jgi:hypothetical protein